MSRVQEAISRHEAFGKRACVDHGHDFLGVEGVVRPSGACQYLVRFRCSCGRESRNHFSKLGPACRVCGNYRHLQRRSEAEWRSKLAEFGHTLVRLERDQTEFKAVYRCGFCRSESRNAYQDIRSPSCKRCAKHFSSFNERLLSDMIEDSLGPGQGLWRNHRGLLGDRYELDAVVVEKGEPILAVEWNGSYWHSFPEVRRKDRIKAERAAAIGLHLLVVLDPAGPDPDFVLRVYNEMVIPALIGDD